MYINFAAVTKPYIHGKAGESEHHSEPINRTSKEIYSAKNITQQNSSRMFKHL